MPDRARIDQPAMRVQVVHSGNAWILRRLARYLVDNLPYVRGMDWRPSALESFDLTYYVNYQLCRRPKAPLRRRVLWRRPRSRIVGAFFPHREDDEFDEVARELDFCVAPSARYANYLREHCNPSSHLIYHGIDLARFTPKLRLGFIGRRYRTGRKGDALLRAVAALPYVELISTEGTLSDREIPAFYQGIDCVLITSSIEGGPLCFQEGLASGKPILSTDVGMVSEFRDAPGVHVYADQAELFALLEAQLQERMKLRQAVSEFSVDYWVREHDRLFRSLIAARP
jgi:glycosyltransferase involved in cell wall biosynthesis